MAAIATAATELERYRCFLSFGNSKNMEEIIGIDSAFGHQHHQFAKWIFLNSIANNYVLRLSASHVLFYYYHCFKRDQDLCNKSVS